MQRPLAVTVGLLAVLAALPAAASLLAGGDDDPAFTFYLHGSAVGNVDGAIETAAHEFNALETPVTIGVSSSQMDETPPVGTSDKVAVTTAFGNANFRKNFLLAYWEGSTSGRVHDVTASIWVVSPVDATLTASLFGDGGIGLDVPFGRASAPVTAGGPTLVTLDFGEAAANVDEHIVLELVGDSDAGGLEIVFDSVQHPSSLAFHLSEPIVVPPTSWTAAPGWANVTLINGSAAHRETSLAISPIDPDLLFVCAPSGVPNTEHGQSFFHVSRDGGATWSYLEVETGSSDPRKLTFEGGDCDVAFDQGGTMYSADTWLGSLSIGHSSDGGLTWTGTPLAASAPVVDRPWLVGGPAGTVHVTWQDLQSAMPSAIWYAKSTDGGLTFSPATSVARSSTNGAFTWTGNLVVSPDQQSLFSVYTRRMGPVLIGTLDDSGPESVWVASSRDGGLTWTEHLVARMPTPASFLYPSLGMDAAGGLHVVFSSRTETDRPIWYARSTDGALTWSAPRKILANVSGWSPWVVGAGAGEAAIQWYGVPDPHADLDAQNDWYFYAARVANGVVTQAGPTTSTPIFQGVSDIPEFNEVRLDAEGKMHIGASAYYSVDGAAGWALFHQREA